MKINSKNTIKSKYLVKDLKELKSIIEERADNLNNCETDILDLTDLNVSRLNSLDNAFGDCFYARCINVTGWDVSRVTNFTRLFCEYDDLEEIIGLDTWDVSNGFDFSNAFRDCISLKEIKGIEKWDVSEGRRFLRMFKHCTSLKQLNLSRWYMGNATTLDEMFQQCFDLKKINISNWDVSNVTSMNYIFEECYDLKENLHSWNVRKTCADNGAFNEAKHVIQYVK